MLARGEEGGMEKGWRGGGLGRVREVSRPNEHARTARTDCTGTATDTDTDTGTDTGEDLTRCVHKGHTYRAVNSHHPGMRIADAVICEVVALNVQVFAILYVPVHILILSFPAERGPFVGSGRDVQHISLRHRTNVCDWTADGRRSAGTARRQPGQP